MSIRKGDVLWYRTSVNTASKVKVVEPPVDGGLYATVIVLDRAPSQMPSNTPVAPHIYVNVADVEPLTPLERALEDVIDGFYDTFSDDLPADYDIERM